MKSEKTSYLLTLDLYFVLLENVFYLEGNVDAYNHVNELIKRVNGGELSFDIKLKVLNSLTKRLQTDLLAKLNLTEIFNEFRATLINEKASTTFEEHYIQALPEALILKNFILRTGLMLDILYNCSFKSSEEIKNMIVNLLSDYDEYLGTTKAKSTVFQPFRNIDTRSFRITHKIYNEWRRS